MGAINGILFGTLLELTFRSIFFYEGYVQEQMPVPPGLHIDMSPYPFSWWYLPVLSLILVTLASFLVHRYLAPSIKSSILLWQAIGLVAVFACSIYSVIFVWYRWYFSEFDFLAADYLAHVIKKDLSVSLYILPAVLGFNLIFALALRLRNGQLTPIGAG